jgi:adenylate kinase family enzyme
MNANKNKRIVVVGTSCSGKTTLAKRIAYILNTEHIELDALYWDANWCPRQHNEFISLVVKAVQKDSWVIDGNYKDVRDMVWNRADAVIWLNYSFMTIFLRALKRTVIRSITKEELFSGNRESFLMSFFSKESILLWVLKTYPIRKRAFPKLFQSDKYSHLKIIELRKTHEADTFIQKLIVTWKSQLRDLP